MGTRKSRHNKGRKPIYKEHRLTFFEASLQIPRERPIGDDNGFLRSVAARELRLTAVQSLTEIDARKVFTDIRWPNGPRCTWCQSVEYYSLNDGRYNCAECGRRFSVTSRTIFSSHKMPFKIVLAAIALTVGATPAEDTTDAAEKLGITHKAAHTFLNKLRGIAGLSDLKDAAAIPKYEIGRPRYWNGAYLSTRCHWAPSEKEALANFVTGGHEPDAAAEALGRSPKSIVHYARDLPGIKLPRSWKSLIYAYHPRQSAPKIILSSPALAYPYINKPRDAHADILEINSLVPKVFPDSMRADICQEIALAVLEGRVTIEELRSNKARGSWFISKFWKENYEQAGHAVSLTGNDGEDRSYDEVASSIAARDWRENEMNDKRRYWDAIRTFTPPTQVEETFYNQVRRRQAALAEQGEMIGFEEVEEIMEAPSPSTTQDDHPTRSR